MSTVTEKPDFTKLSKKTFRFDWVTSLILASIVLAGSIVLWLSAVWVTNRVWKVATAPVPVEIIEIALDAEEGRQGVEFEGGEAQEIMPNELPAREEDVVFDQPEIAEVMSNVLDALAENEADLTDPARKAGKRSAGRPGSPSGRGKEGTGPGSSAVPRSQRWSIHYSQTQTLVAYAKMLDYFGIEIGVLRPSGTINYVSGLGGTRPVVKTSDGAGEDRLYFVWQSPERRKADIELLKKAKIDASTSVIAHFYPRELEDQLAKMELSFENRKVEQIQRTRYGVRRTAGGYEFYVMNQTAAE